MLLNEKKLDGKFEENRIEREKMKEPETRVNGKKINRGKVISERREVREGKENKKEVKDKKTR